MPNLLPHPPDLTDEQREIQALAARVRADRDPARSPPRSTSATPTAPLDVVHKAAGVGLTSYMLPEEVGGGGIADV